MECMTQELTISSILVAVRIRKDTGRIEELAADIEERGLIHAIAAMDCGDGKYQLIAGLRRLEAVKSLGRTSIRATILSPMDAEEQLRMEYAENVQRKDFTVSERTEYAEKIKAVEKAKARERMVAYARDGHGDERQGVRICTPPEKGKARDLIAKKAGFSSARQYERAAVVAAKQPDLLEKVDTGELTISGAYKQATQETKEVVPLEAPPDAERPRADQIARAGHDRLMKNPLYAQLQQDLREARHDANHARAELDRRETFFKNQVKHFTSNIDALRMQCDKLIAENAALQARLDNGNTSLNGEVQV